MTIQITKRFSGSYYVKGNEDITIQSYEQWSGMGTQNAEGDKWVLTMDLGGSEEREFFKTKKEAVEFLKRNM